MAVAVCLFLDFSPFAAKSLQQRER